tara:strand:- start:902 stop:1123 length:222 start_codon:yes stop_codon:yes gene_type:complete
MPMCVLVKSKSFMIESEQGQWVAKLVEAITTENGWPLEPGLEPVLDSLVKLMVFHETRQRLTSVLHEMRQEER